MFSYIDPSAVIFCTWQLTETGLTGLFNYISFTAYKVSSGLKYGLYFIVSNRSRNQIRASCHTFEAVDLTHTVNVDMLMIVYTHCLLV